MVKKIIEQKEITDWLTKPLSAGEKELITETCDELLARKNITLASEKSFKATFERIIKALCEKKQEFNQLTSEYQIITCMKYKSLYQFVYKKKPGNQLSTNTPKKDVIFSLEPII